MAGGNRHLFVYEDFDLYETDAVSFEDKNWLTDIALNFAVSYLYNQTAEQNPQIRDKVSVVYASHCELLKYTPEGEQMDKMLEEIIGGSHNKWLLFLFNNSGTHWSLLLFDPNRKQFILFDSLERTRCPNDVHDLVNKLAIAFGCHHSHDQLLVLSSTHPLMQTFGDCGVFVVEYSRTILESLSRNHQADAAFHFSRIDSDDIDSIRQRWIEIIRERTA